MSNNLNRDFNQFANAREMYEELLNLTKKGGEYTVRNFVGVIGDMSMAAATVTTELFPEGALEYYAKKNMGEKYSKEEKTEYQLETRGGEQGDYSYGIEGKIDNVVRCLREYPHSKRAVLPIPFAEQPSTEVDFTNQGQTKCVRELYFYLEDGMLECTGILRMQNAVIFPKNIYYIARLMQHIAGKLKADVGKYTHFITHLCLDRSASHC